MTKKSDLGAFRGIAADMPRSALSMRGYGTSAEMERFFQKLTRFSVIGIFVIAVATACYIGQYVIAPVIAAILVGLTLGPLNGWMERRGIPGALSAALIVIVFTVTLGLASVSIAVPLESWSSRLPAISTRVMEEWSKVSAPLEKMKDVEKQLKEAMAEEYTQEVTIKQRGVVTDIISSAADILSRLILFVGCLYFFLATRTSVKRNFLKILPASSSRLRLARIMRDSERFLSRYVLAITIINIAFGVAVGIAMWILGMPQPYLWGVLAAVLNYALFVGPAVMAVILAGVGLVTFPETFSALAPAAVYLGLNVIEGQFITPTLLGGRLTLNPFAVLVSIAFWLWMWGPIGAFLAVPMLIVMTMIIYHASPASRMKAAALKDKPTIEDPIAQTI